MGFTDARPCWEGCKWPMGFPSFFLWTKEQVFHKPLKVRPFFGWFFGANRGGLVCSTVPIEYSEFEVSAYQYENCKSIAPSTNNGHFSHIV